MKSIKKLYERFLREADLQWDFDDDKGGPAKGPTDQWSKRDKNVPTTGQKSAAAPGKKSIQQVRTLPPDEYSGPSVGPNDIWFPEDLSQEQVRAWNDLEKANPNGDYDFHDWVFSYDEEDDGEFVAKHGESSEILSWDEKMKQWVYGDIM